MEFFDSLQARGAIGVYECFCVGGGTVELLCDLMITPAFLADGCPHVSVCVCVWECVTLSAAFQDLFLPELLETGHFLVHE